jgi:hypothetical protein
MTLILTSRWSQFSGITFMQRLIPSDGGTVQLSGDLTQ